MAGDAPKFGTSGLRGRVVDLTDALIADYARAFAAACETGTGVFLGHDLRASSPAITAVLAVALRGEGLPVTLCGALPTPALALAASDAGAAAIMVTGSHIPADRNGLKFYTPAGEIGKADETAILAALGRPPAGLDAPQAEDRTAAERFTGRYLTAFGQTALTGLKIGVYAHSAVGRDLLADILRRLGTHVTELGRSDAFVAVDTEAVSAETRAQLRHWAEGLDAIASTDGDSDRPLLTDERGEVIPGDILGQITAEIVGAQTVVTPISSNTGILQKGFGEVIRTRIGSPHVIAAMAGAERPLGYEANGGTLLGFDAEGPAGLLPALPTRDAILPILATLVSADGPLSTRIATEPPRFTASDRLKDVSTDRSRALIERLAEDAGARADFLTFTGSDGAELDRLDGLRMTLSDGGIVHLRPSGNAPEARVYVEAESPARSHALLAGGLDALQRALNAQ